MKVVVNQYTDTVHRHQGGSRDYETVCGATYHVEADHLHVRQVDKAGRGETTKCGRCFEGAGGY